MEIALTKKLAKAMGVKPAPNSQDINPLFSWTANWVNTFDGRKEDMIVIMNNATRFTVTIYGVRWNQFGDIMTKMTAAIRNTLLAMSLNPDAVDEYLRLARDIEFTLNHDRTNTARLNHQGLGAAFLVGRRVNESWEEVKYQDTWGQLVSRGIVNYGDGSDDAFVPAERMIQAISELTGQPAYRYRAFELLVTLDLHVYKAQRRLIVPAAIEFSRLHKVLQDVFDWEDCHLHEFAVYDEKRHELVARLAQNNGYSYSASDTYNESEHRLSEYFPKNKYILYTYDMGDSWEHVIEFVREIAEHNEDSPYLLEAIGQSPPEDVGGVSGFVNFREIMLDNDHPDYADLKEWVGYWSPELTNWKARPRVLYH